MSSVLTAILGGSTAVLLGALARSLGIPSDVRAHDVAIADRDDQLATWTADRDYELRQECERLRLDGNPQPVFEPAVGTREERLDQAIAERRGLALHQWRDEARSTGLDVANILAAEGWPHRAYRKLTKKATPTLTTPERATPLLDAWRKPSAISSGAMTRPNDATKRTLDDAIATMPVTGP